jgi:hypothetical protein
VGDFGDCPAGIVTPARAVMDASDLLVASVRTADVMRTDVCSELESGHWRHGAPNGGSGSDYASSVARPSGTIVALDRSALAGHFRPFTH